MADGNPSGICTWQDVSECADCGLDARLNCRWQAKALIGFFLMFLPFGLTSWVGLVYAGVFSKMWWPVYVYIGFYVFFFGDFEIRVLCSHCPYYAREGATLKCPANHGMPKVWKYRPGPMSRTENFLLRLGLYFFACWPIFFQVWGIAYLAAGYQQYGPGPLLWLALLTAGTAVSAAVFFLLVRRRRCGQCVNFSCFMNRVPKETVDAYLARNEVMRRAWEEAGYHIGEGMGLTEEE